MDEDKQPAGAPESQWNLLFFSDERKWNAEQNAVGKKLRKAIEVESQQVRFSWNTIHDESPAIFVRLLLKQSDVDTRWIRKTLVTEISINIKLAWTMPRSPPIYIMVVMLT